MPGVERTSRVVSESRTLEGVHGGIWESWCRARAQQKGNPLSPPLGVIEVIHVAPRGTNVAGRRVLVVASTVDYAENQPPMKKMKSRLEPIAFDDEDLEGTIQLHDDVLVITAWINGFLMKMGMVD